MQSTLQTRQRAQNALDYLTEHPERHAQSSWIEGDYTLINAGDNEYGWKPNEENLCGTTMCVAGTVTWQADGVIMAKDVDDRAAELLGLDEDEGMSLFFSYDEDQAINLLTAVAQGDGAKFKALAAEAHEDW